jgi:hypothetical protein
VLITHISDFYDKSQISSVVLEAADTNERIKLLDLIMKRRDEMHELEEQLRLEKVSPVIKKFARDFKLKLSMKNGLVSKEKKKPRQQRRNPESDASNSIATPSIPSPVPEVSDQFSNTPNPSTFQMESKSQIDELKLSEGNAGRKLKFMLVKTSPNKNDIEKKLLDIAERSMSKKSLCQSRNPMDFDSASKVLENDLYKYLIRNTSPTNKELLFTENKTQQPKKPTYGKLKVIEEHVKHRFDNFTRENHKRNYNPSMMLNSSRMNSKEFEPSFETTKRSNNFVYETSKTKNGMPSESQIKSSKNPYLLPEPTKEVKSSLNFDRSAVKIFDRTRVSIPSLDKPERLNLEGSRSNTVLPKILSPMSTKLYMKSLASYVMGTNPEKSFESTRKQEKQNLNRTQPAFFEGTPKPNFKLNLSKK